MNISDVMVRRPVSCSSEMMLDKVAFQMWNNDCGCVPVINEGSEPIGVLTDRDIAMCSAFRGKALNEIKVIDMLEHSPLVICKESDGIPVAIKLMDENRVRRLPVVDEENKLVGMVTFGDILACANVSSYDISRKAVDKMVRSVSGHHGEIRITSGT